MRPNAVTGRRGRFSAHRPHQPVSLSYARPLTYYVDVFSRPLPRLASLTGFLSFHCIASHSHHSLSPVSQPVCLCCDCAYQFQDPYSVPCLGPSFTLGSRRPYPWAIWYDSFVSSPSLIWFPQWPTTCCDYWQSRPLASWRSHHASAVPDWHIATCTPTVVIVPTWTTDVQYNYLHCLARPEDLQPESFIIKGLTLLSPSAEVTIHRGALRINPIMCPAHRILPLVYPIWLDSGMDDDDLPSAPGHYTPPSSS